MNPLGKEQSTVFETLEKGNFIAPADGDLKDEQDIPLLKAACKLLLPGLALSVLVLGVLSGAELLVFLGALLVAVGAGKLAEESRIFAAAVILAVLQALVLGFVLVAQTFVQSLMETAPYTAAGYAAPVIGALIPTALTAGVWKAFPKCRAAMLTLAVAGVIAAAVTVAAPGLTLLRLLPAAAGLAALIWLAILTFRE